MVTLDNYLFFAWAGRKMMYKCTYFDENFSHRWNIDWIGKKKYCAYEKSKVYYTHQILNVAITTKNKGRILCNKAKKNLRIFQDIL